jgi:GDP-L-fucose synthase
VRRSSRVYVAGHTGLVGSALVRCLRGRGHRKLVLRTRAELDLTRQEAVESFFRRERPEYVFLAAARVGGILANRDRPADFVRDNLLIQSFVLDAAHRYGARKVLVLGSSCIYPKLAAQPIHEDALLTGPLEPTNKPYAVAKIAGLTMAQAYRRQHGLDTICLMPTNLYGPGDCFDAQGSHVIPGLLRRMHEAKQSAESAFVVWGSGRPRREFLHVDDLAEACELFMRTYSSEELLNVGCGEDITIRELAEVIREVTGFSGALVFDSNKPDGTPRKLLDVGRARGLGWSPRRELAEGIAETYAWFLAHQGSPALRL